MVWIRHESREIEHIGSAHTDAEWELLKAAEEREGQRWEVCDVVGLEGPGWGQSAGASPTWTSELTCPRQGDGVRYDA